MPAPTLDDPARQAAGEDWTVVTVPSTVDVGAAPELRQELLDLVSAGQVRLVLDLTAVEFLDTTGLSVLIAVHKLCRAAGGEVRLAGAHASVAKVLRVSGLHQVFPSYATVAEAQAA